MPAVIHDKQIGVRKDEEKCRLYSNEGQKLEKLDRRQFQNGVPVCALRTRQKGTSYFLLM